MPEVILNDELVLNYLQESDHNKCLVSKRACPQDILDYLDTRFFMTHADNAMFRLLASYTDSAPFDYTYIQKGVDYQNQMDAIYQHERIQQLNQQ